MLIGFDFDNTIVCYDKAVERLANEILDLPTDFPKTKLALRDFLRQTNRESEWTAFQGALYGPGMVYAEPFDQVLETMQALKDLGHSLCIVSHRSRRPYSGPPHDLHVAAREWIERRLGNRGLIEHRTTYFYETREQKIAAVRVLGCEAFLDDLPEVLEDDHFPDNCRAILFDPESSHVQSKKQRVRHWGEVIGLIGLLK